VQASAQSCRSVFRASIFPLFLPFSDWVEVMVFNATFNNISVVLMEDFPRLDFETVLTMWYAMFFILLYRIICPRGT
jgi:hypothetical protein